MVRGVAAWVFGFATTIFLIALWGRAVVVDIDALQDATKPFAESPVVVGALTDWLEVELADVGVDADVSALVIEEVVEQSAVAAALERFAAELVLAAAAPAPADAVIDVGVLLQPAVPEIGAVLASTGVPVSESRLSELLAGLDPLMVRGPDARPYVGPASPAAARLGRAAVLALSTMALSGWVVVGTSDDRWGELKGLLTRMALGALSFSLLLKTGSWVIDPEGGRAPVMRSASIVAASKWLVPLALAGIAGAGASLVRVTRRRLDRRADTAGRPPTQPHLEEPEPAPAA